MQNSHPGCYADLTLGEFSQLIANVHQRAQAHQIRQKTTRISKTRMKFPSFESENYALPTCQPQTTQKTKSLLPFKKQTGSRPWSHLLLVPGPHQRSAPCLAKLALPNHLSSLLCGLNPKPWTLNRPQTLQHLLPKLQFGSRLSYNTISDARHAASSDFWVCVTDLVTRGIYDQLHRTHALQYPLSRHWIEWNCSAESIFESQWINKY